MKLTLSSAIVFCLSASAVHAQTPTQHLDSWIRNPIIRGQFTADPTARVFNNKVYLYPSHDIVPPAGQRQDWFCMEDYHVFSSENLVDWTDHGIIISQEQVPWGKPDGYSMWAPDCVERDGTYYFYFPDAPKEGRGFAIGVATANHPEGPFKLEKEPIKGIAGIDPCVLVDKDGQAYIYWAGMGIRGAKLKDNMKEVDGEQMEMQGLPEGFKEGPFVFRRGEWYYLTFPWVRGKKSSEKDNPTETLAYAMSKSPLGPWEFKGLIMAEHENGCWTNHHSLVEYRGQWFLFYHHNDLSPNDDKRRSVCIDRVSFNHDGTIQQVAPTRRGVGFKEQLTYFRPVSPNAVKMQPDDDGFIRRWMLLEPIDYNVRSNTILTEGWLHEHLEKQYFKGQFDNKHMPRDGEKVTAIGIALEGGPQDTRRQNGPVVTKEVKQTLRWHAMDSETYNVKVFRFAEMNGCQPYNSLFWGVTIVDCPEDISDIRLAVGSNGASMWWLNGERVLTLDGDRRMVEDDCMSQRITLKKGRNILRFALINGPGLSDFCVRFIDEKGKPVTRFSVTVQ